MRKYLYFFVMVFAVCIYSFPAYSALIEGRFSGRMIGSLFDGAGVFGAAGESIAAPVPVTGVFSYDTEFLNIRSLSSSNSANYFVDDDDWLSISITINGKTIDLKQTDMSNSYGTRASVGVINDIGYDQVGIGMTSYCTLCEITYFNFSIDLAASTSLLSSTDLAINMDYTKELFPVSDGEIYFSIKSLGSSYSTTSGSSYIALDQLSISTVPIPAAAWLFGSGLIGLIGFSKCKRAAS